MIGRQGFGFWDTTHCPVGGSFKRFGVNETVENVEPMFHTYMGATHTGTIVRDGKKLTIAFGNLAVEPQIKE